MIILIINEESSELNNLLNSIKEYFPEVVSIMYAVTNAPYADRYKLDYKLFFGNTYLTEELKGLKFKTGAVSFFQPNPAQAENLFHTAIEFADIKKKQIVYDVYCGTGTLSCIAATAANKVIGVEYSPEAIALAKENAVLNNLNNISFYNGDVRNVLTPAFVYNNGIPDVVITDPPRAGMSPFVVHRLLRMESPKIVYISCNPTAQVRDLKLLSKKYLIKKLQPLDMFPQTAHIENIALLELR